MAGSSPGLGSRPAGGFRGRCRSGRKLHLSCGIEQRSDAVCLGNGGYGYRHLEGYRGWPGRGWLSANRGVDDLRISTGAGVSYPLRYLYRTAYDPDKQQTLVFEELRNRRDAGLAGRYPWRHRMLWLQGRKDGAIRYDFDDDGDTPPAAVSAWVHDGSIEAVRSLRVKNSREVPMILPAVDRLGGLDILRAMDLAPGASWTRAGAGPKGSLTFQVTVEDKEIIETDSRQWSAWRLRVEEQRHRQGAQNPPPLYVWIADDAGRTPVRFSIHHLVGRIRLSIE